MSKKVLSNEEIEVLQINPNVKKVSQKSITYIDTFKIKFMESYTKGSIAIAIFINAGFDIDVIGTGRVNESSSRWRKQYIRDEGLIDTRKNTKGRLAFNSLDETDKTEYIIAQNEYLKQENAFLKKLQAEERRLKKRVKQV